MLHDGVHAWVSHRSDVGGEKAIAVHDRIGQRSVLRESDFGGGDHYWMRTTAIDFDGQNIWFDAGSETGTVRYRYDQNRNWRIYRASKPLSFGADNDFDMTSGDRPSVSAYGYTWLNIGGRLARLIDEESSLQMGGAFDVRIDAIYSGRAEGTLFFDSPSGVFSLTEHGGLQRQQIRSGRRAASLSGDIGLQLG